MFKVGNLKICFKHFKYVDVGFEKLKTGKFGVTCTIYKEDREIPLFQGTVRPYYKDQPDRILGKKYALREALVSGRLKRKSDGKDVIFWNFIQAERTEIWNAFWEWVESWDKKKKIEFVGYVDCYQPYLNPALSTDLEIKCTALTDDIHKNIIRIIGKNVKITMEEI